MVQTQTPLSEGMMAKKRKKNKIIFPVVLVCCLAAMIVALVMLKDHNSKSPELQSGESTETVTAFQRSGVIITKVQFKGKTDELSFVFENVQKLTIKFTKHKCTLSHIPIMG